MEIDRKKLISVYSKALESNAASMFIGAGLSVDSGYIDWINLLREPAKEIQLEVEKEKHDLVTLAQYYVNRNKRSNLDAHLLDNYGVLKEPNKNHRIISKLPLTTIWTTNYDRLIENAFTSEGKIVDVKFEDKQLRNSISGRDVVVYKMHGDIQLVDKVVITRDDYQAYDKYHELFREVLEGELVSRTFLFIGFGFNDPNLSNVISRLRILLDGSPREHFCVLKRISEEYCLTLKLDFNYEKNKQKLQIEDLSRFGINVCLINDYEEVTSILEEILNITRRKTIFISGAAASYLPFSNENAVYFIINLTKRILNSKRGYRIINGFGNGVGEYILSSAIEEDFSNKNKRIIDQITLMPFPFSLKDKKKKFYTKYRENMIEKSGISVFLFGNKLADNQIINSDGMFQEYTIAIKNGSIALPIQITGSMASHIYEDALINHSKITTEIKYKDLLMLCAVDASLSVNRKADIDKIITKILKAINELNSFESED